MVDESLRFLLGIPMLERGIVDPQSLVIDEMTVLNGKLQRRPGYTIYAPIEKCCICPTPPRFPVTY